MTIAAAVPSRWQPIGGGPVQETSWGDDTGIQIVPIAVRGPLDEPATLRWNGKALRRLLGDFRPDVLQIEAEPWTPIATTAMSAARRLGIPVVLVSRESLPRSLGLVERVRRDRVLRHAAAVIAANSFAARLIAGNRPSLRTVTIPGLSVALPPLLPPSEHEKLSIGFLGRLVPERGLDLLFRACVTLPGRWSVTVVGTGPAQEELEGLAERLGIAANVTWLGALPRQAIDAVWPTLDCVALPSRSTEQWVDTIGRAALDAMAHGLPVIAADSGTLPDIVAGGGRIVPQDDVPALAAALGALLADPALRHELGTAGRRRVMEEYSDSAVARRTLDCWRGTVDASPAPELATA